MRAGGAQMELGVSIQAKAKLSTHIQTAHRGRAQSRACSSGSHGSICAIFRPRGVSSTQPGSFGISCRLPFPITPSRQNSIRPARDSSL